MVKVIFKLRLKGTFCFGFVVSCIHLFVFIQSKSVYLLLICFWCVLLFCFSFKGEEKYCSGPAEAAPVRDGANRQDVWRPGDHSTDAVHEVRKIHLSQKPCSFFTAALIRLLLWFYLCDLWKSSSCLTSSHLFVLIFTRDGRMLFDYLSEKHNVSI